MAHYMVKDTSISNGYLDEYEAFFHFTSQEELQTNELRRQHLKGIRPVHSD